jgi:hypothetical protein
MHGSGTGRTGRGVPAQDEVEFGALGGGAERGELLAQLTVRAALGETVGDGGTDFTNERHRALLDG